MLVLKSCICLRFRITAYVNLVTPSVYTLLCISHDGEFVTYNSITDICNTVYSALLVMPQNFKFCLNDLGHHTGKRRSHRNSNKDQSNDTGRRKKREFMACLRLNKRA